jgi:hypothetical protein
MREDILNGCGLKESLGSPTCKENNLCEECQAKLSGYDQAMKEVLEKMEDKIKKQNSLVILLE